jgi:hypothetical protein
MSTRQTILILGGGVGGLGSAARFGNACRGGIAL